MLFKRKTNWYYKFTVKGQTVYRSTGTSDKEQAQAIYAKAYSDALNQIKSGNQKPRYIWQDAVIRWLSESENKSIETEKYHLRWLAKHLDDVYLDEITHDVIEKIIKEKLKEAGTTRVNRTTGIISAILNKACKKWGWLESTPYIRKFKESNQRLRWLSRDEVVRLLPELQPHTQAMMLFTLATGLRESNVTGLEWNQVDMQNKVAWIHGDQSKNGKPIRIPLNQDALTILRQQIGKHHKYVFAYKGNPIIKASTKAWRSALKRADIDDFCWHGLRHTWASWHVQAGTPLNVLQELGGWSDYKMVLRYAHLAPEHLAEHANRLTPIVAKSVAPDNVTKVNFR
jgi:integrase